MTTLWMPEAVRFSGSDSKIGYDFGSHGPKRGDVKHSAEGDNWSVMHALLTGPARKSWHFTIGYDRIEQHYPIDANCWHAGDADDDGAVNANRDLIGIEHLGVAGTPLTEWQIEATVRVTQFCADQWGFAKFGRYPVAGAIAQHIWTLAEHTELSDTYTACPSGRIPWDRIMTELEGDDAMPTPEQEALWNGAAIKAQHALNQLETAKALILEAFKRIGATDEELDTLKRQLAEAGQD
jgi:N-acetyl-anhydromuramyl-L-alanine amidase AmpD